MVFSIWSLPTLRVDDNCLIISFYVTVGFDHFVIGLYIISKVHIALSKGTLFLPGPDNDFVILSTSLDSPSVSSILSYLSTFPSHIQVVVSLYSLCDALRNKRHIIGQGTKPISPGVVKKRISYNIYAHFHHYHNYFITMCQLANILASLLSNSVLYVHLHCTARFPPPQVLHVKFPLLNSHSLSTITFHWTSFG